MKEEIDAYENAGVEDEEGVEKRIRRINKKY